jgi:diguanylate cyclase (GGDEF)-like protein
VVASAASGVPLAIRADGALFDAAERRLVQQMVDLIQRDSVMRADHAALDQRLRMVERENLDLSMKNRALADISSRDSLTGLFTRWYVLDKIEAEMNRALRHGSPMSLLMIDVDHFKQVNDSFGHQTGDMVLQHLGQLLRDSCRMYDVPGRYGGEEFCLMLPETRLENTLAVAERIRRRVESTPMGASDGTIRVTASIGIAALDNIPDEALMGAASLIERADRALYSAKDNGRNRIEFWNAAQTQQPHRAFEH